MSSDDTERRIMGMDVNVGPTPEERANIDSVVARFDEDWMLDVTTQEIKRKPRNIIRVTRDFFLPRRHTVFALYWWCKRKFHREHRCNLMAFTFPVEHDNMPIPGYPMKYEIKGSWRIPKRDRKYLTKGPLARISTNEILVTHNIGLEKFRALIKLWGPPLGFIAALMAIFVHATNILNMFE